MESTSSPFDLAILQTIRGQIDSVFIKLSPIQYGGTYMLSEPNAKDTTFAVVLSRKITHKTMDNLMIILKSRFDKAFSLSHDRHIVKVHARNEYQRQILLKEGESKKSA